MGQLLKAGAQFDIVYMDPPYIGKGDDLYPTSMSAEDHERLARILRYEKRDFLLSYDDHETARRLYSNNRFLIRKTDTVMSKKVYTMAGHKRVNNRVAELLITPIRARHRSR